MIRLAAPTDVPVLLQLVKELAIYEKEPDAVLGNSAAERLQLVRQGDD